MSGIQSKKADYRNDIKGLSDEKLMAKINHLWKYSEYDERNFRMYLYAKKLAIKRGLIEE